MYIVCRVFHEFDTFTDIFQRLLGHGDDEDSSDDDDIDNDDNDMLMRRHVLAGADTHHTNGKWTVMAAMTCIVLALNLQWPQ